MTDSTEAPRRQMAPPPKSFLPGVATEQPPGPDGRLVLELDVPALACLVDAAGRLTTGALATAVDSAGGLATGLSVLPGWVVTTNLTLRRSPAALGGRTAPSGHVLRSDVLRAGRSAAVARVVVTDDDGVEVATGFITSAVLEPEGGAPTFDRPVRVVSEALTDDPADAPRLEDFFGLEPGSRPGEGRLDITPERRNPWGILYGGATAALLDVTATSAVAGLPVGTPTPDHVVTDLIVHYFSPGRVGPVVATSERLGGRGRDQLVRLDLHDTGADDRPLVTAVATVRDLGDR